jgi:hypothetical protein
LTSFQKDFRSNRYLCALESSEVMLLNCSRNPALTVVRIMLLSMELSQEGMHDERQALGFFVS